MLIGSLADTVMNLLAFAFIAAMIWLCIRPLARPADQIRNEDDKSG